MSQFWLSMFFAQIFAAWWAPKIRARRLVMIASLTAFFCSLPLWNMTNIESLIFLAVFWGLANLALLKAILSFATEIVKVPGPRLVSLLLLAATKGTAISPFITSQIVERKKAKTALVFGSGCYYLLLFLMLTASTLHRQRSTVKNLYNLLC